MHTVGPWPYQKFSLKKNNYFLLSLLSFSLYELNLMHVTSRHSFQFIQWGDFLPSLLENKLKIAFEGHIFCKEWMDTPFWYPLAGPPIISCMHHPCLPTPHWYLHMLLAMKQPLHRDSSWNTCYYCFSFIDFQLSSLYHFCTKPKWVLFWYTVIWKFNPNL